MCGHACVAVVICVPFGLLAACKYKCHVICSMKDWTCTVMTQQNVDVAYSWNEAFLLSIADTAVAVCVVDHNRNE